MQASPEKLKSTIDLFKATESTAKYAKFSYYGSAFDQEALQIVSFH